MNNSVEPDDILEEIDKAMAVHILARLKAGDATAAELEAIRKFLDLKGYRGPTPSAVRKTGVDDPRASLDSIPDTVLALFNND